MGVSEGVEFEEDASFIFGHMQMYGQPCNLDARRFQRPRHSFKTNITHMTGCRTCGMLGISKCRQVICELEVWLSNDTSQSLRMAMSHSIMK